ncbi:hypothetical protein [Paenibacillus macerans]|uniref:hypothetical protein n=1 Tax=Paenibacillus macerans TaxID=44252 RepID=UPI00203BFC4F|nr:hypothetical protein [Paenibacillus macerans]MCM3699924.1 hypothetical protein [Paenibacillus macerans]
METIYRQLDVVRRRIRWFRGLDGLRYGLLTGLAAALIWLAAGRLWPLEYGKIGAGVFLVLCTAGGWVWGRLRRVSVILAAQTMDRPEAGQERLDLMTTALAYAKLQTFPAQLEREQAEEYGAAYVRDIKKRLPLPRRRVWRIPAALCLLASLLLATLPNPLDQRVAQAREERGWVNAQKEETNGQITKLDRLKLDMKAKEALAKEMSELRRALEKSREPGEALKNVEETMKRLREMSEKLELQQQARTEWLKRWDAHPLAGELANALRNKSTAELTKQMEAFHKQLSGLTQQERDELADKLKRIAEAAPPNDERAKELADALKKAAAAVNEGQKLSTDQALANLNEAMLQNMQAAEASSGQADVAAELASALAEQGLDLAENMQASGLAVSDTWSMGGSAEQLAAGGGPGMGQEGPGIDTGPGAGQGQGGGNGVGAGLGSGGRALVTTPRDLAGSGNAQQDGGPATGGSVQKGGSSPVFDGVSRPYEEVYSDYAAEAKESLKRGDLPQSLQSLVENYFTEIDPGS